MPENWKTYKLGEMTNWKSGATPSKSKPEFWNGNIPWISARTLTGRYVSSSPLSISEAALTKGGRMAEKGSILFLVRGSGLFNDIPVAMVSRDVAFNQDIKCVVPTFEGLDDLFLLYWFKGNKQTFTNILEVTGIGAGKFDMSRVFNLNLNLPPLPEQHEIAAILSALDDKIENNLAMNKTLEDMAMTLYKHWFVDFGPFQDGNFIDSELGMIPEGWEVINLGDLFNLKHGYAFKGKFFTKEERSELLLTPGNFERNGGIKFNWGKQKFYSGEVPEDYILRKGELILALTDLTQSCDILGAPAFIPDNDYQYLHNQRLGLIELKDEHISKDFIFCIANSVPFREYMKGTKTGSTVSHTSPTRVYQFKTVYPPGNSVKLFYDKLRSFNGRRFSNLSENKILTQLRDTLLPKLISGEVRVKDIDKSVSEVL